MDSLTQIVLGAAVGEAVLGKKVGNRAMLWGAIAGTIPDLDVVAGSFMSPLNGLAFHRGISHSLFFSVFGSLLLGWVVFKMYNLSFHKWVGLCSWSILLFLLSSLLTFGGHFSIIKCSIGILILCLGSYVLYKKYFNSKYNAPSATLKQWQWMFFLSLVTHPILDCFTTYGTQFLSPFSATRIAFNNISVADPAFTLPFLLCLFIAMSYPMGNPRRSKWNTIGIVISSVYMVFTIGNKVNIDKLFRETLRTENIAYKRYMTTPTILNNVLWSGIAETDSAFYYGQYSYFDKEDKFKLTRQEKSWRFYSDSLKDDQTLKILRWFSSDYFIIQNKNVDTLQYFDLRFGTFRTKASDPDNFVFKFNILEKSKNNFVLLDKGAGPRDAKFGKAFAALWNRILGKLDHI